MNDKLNQREIKKIEELYDHIIETGGLENDLLSLLCDGVLALKQNLFYASVGVFTVVLEKLLRDQLVMSEYIKDSGDSNDSGNFMVELERIEEMIEDGTDGNHYTFGNICKKLVVLGKIEENISIELVQIYKELRIPIQHGIYGRLIREQTGGAQAPITVIKTNPEQGPEQLMKDMIEGMKQGHNSNINIHNPVVRTISLPPILKQKSIHMLLVIDDLVKILKD